MGDDSGNLQESEVRTIMVVTVLVLFFVIVFVFFLHLYAKWFLQRRENQEQNSNSPSTTANRRRRRRRRFDFAPGYEEMNVMAALKRGLDPSVLKTIPIVVFSNENQDFKDGGLECAVCLCEVSDGEEIRFLPKCKHGFHVECIDMWFQSHSTCPLCRNTVSNVEDGDPTVQAYLTIQGVPNTAPALTDSLNFPTNVLYWGNETQVSILGEGTGGASSSSSSSPEVMLVIDIPIHGAEEAEEQLQKSSQLPNRMRSFKRLLSSSRENNCRRLSPHGDVVDLEQQQQQQ